MTQNSKRKITQEIHYEELTIDEKKTVLRAKEIKAYSLVILGTIIYSLGVVWILRLGGFFSGGATGASQLIVGLVEKFCTNKSVVQFISDNLGTLVLLINIPLLCFGWRGVSKRFALLTLISIIVQTLVMNVLSKYTISPFVLLIKDNSVIAHIPTDASESVVTLLKNEVEGLIDIFKSSQFTLLKNETTASAQEIFIQSMSVGTRLLLAVIGGLICGIGAAMCLKNGGSTGGMDIIANYLQVKKQIPFTKYQSIVDTTIIVLSGIISVENVMFTIIRLIVYMRMIDAVYKIYKTDRIEIVTTKGEEVRTALIKYLKHGLTIYQCVGGFTKGAKDSIVVYASNFETPLYIEAVKEIDEHAFISVTKTKILKGNFVQKTIV